ncbi:Pyridoxal phosphate-dependent transferase, major domain protein [Metarhizium album ARSEF 1941]|uniref:Pyridoxal phosphate-dependent transferase, major domain protein n=1 Tax=Metarhizium album (strain ARSEF 1941) TaxID=1081103 RepID=A0A0B2WUQ6_METAS|nr:Pyridoxal phosphate-dependent transferase, major domain protein [Metarhizium album ARSEF 1941]KHN99776.1 Pyridoxal phosphate-dependent transferase, major domain protein [Metarhizium album ARSEF 1941]
MLSRRAREQIPPSAFNVMWEVMKDPWDAYENPSGYVNVGVAENHLMQAELDDYLSQHVDMRGSVLTYQDGPMGSRRLRAALARFLNRQLRPYRALDASQIIVTNGVSNALEHTSWAFANPGDAFVLGRPYYGAVNLALRPQMLTLPVAFGQVDPLSLEAVACYEEAIVAARQQGTAVRGLLLCSPHNPLGQCYSPHVLEAFLKLCDRHRIHLVCDEIYALSVWAGAPFTSVIALRLEQFIDPALVHVLWGVSKDFGANGWRLGCIISLSNRAFHTAMNSVAIYSYVSSITDHVVTQMMEDDGFVDGYLAENRRRLASMYAFATDFLRRHGIPYAPGVHAAFFLWVDLGQAYRDRHPDRAEEPGVVEELKQALWAHKVYLAWGGNFDSESPGMFRIVFAHPRAYLEEALRRINQALERGVQAATWTSSLL